jgi:hypothetical protein
MARRGNSLLARRPGTRAQARNKLSRFRHIASLSSDPLTFAPDHRRIRLSLRLDYRPPLRTLDPRANTERYITSIVRSSQQERVRGPLATKGVCVQPTNLTTYRRRRELVQAGERAGLAPAEHPATTLRRDADAARVPQRTHYPSMWDCRSCGRPNLLGDSSCRGCGRDRATNGGRR